MSLCCFVYSLSAAKRLKTADLTSENSSIFQLFCKYLGKLKSYHDETLEIVKQDHYEGGYKKDQQLIELQDSSAARQQMQLQEEADLQSLQEQEQSIRQLESDINDVNQIFKELGSLVHEQGETIDSIEASVERTENYVQQGARQLGEASVYKNKIRRKKCFLIGIGSVVLTVIIIIIIWQCSN